MGQLFSSEEDLSQAKDAIGSLLYAAMLEGGAVPDLGVVHPLLLANQGESFDSRDGLKKQLQQLQGDIGNKAPTYLRDLINRLTTFSDEPRLAGLVGLVVTMVMDMVYSSSKTPSLSGGKGKSSSQQRVWDLQEVMEEYLKRCRINLNHKDKLIQDSSRLEAQLSLTLTQLKTSLLGGDCDSRSLRHWASGAAFHTQMMVHLAGLEGHVEPLAARAALEQYREDLDQILPAYRRYKSNTVCVVKCRGGLQASCDPSSETPDDGSMTGLTVTDRETGKSVTIPLSAMETQIGRRNQAPLSDSAPESTSSSVNLDLITSDQYAQAYLDYLFSDNGAVAELRNYFTKASEKLKTLRTDAVFTKKTTTELGNGMEESGGGGAESEVGGVKGGAGGEEEQQEMEERLESLKLSIVETNEDLYQGETAT